MKKLVLAVCLVSLFLLSVSGVITGNEILIISGLEALESENNDALPEEEEVSNELIEYRPPPYEGDALVAASFVDWGGQSLEELPWDIIDLVDVSAFVPTKGGGIDYSSSTARSSFDELSSIDTGDTKIIAKLGGWTGSTYFSDAALEENRDDFAEDLLALIRKHDLDGVEVNWEFPAGGGLSGNIERPEDLDNFYLFLENIREVLTEAEEKDEKKYYVSISNTASVRRAQEYDVKRVCNTINFMKIQGYGLAGRESTDFNDQLYGVEGQEYTGNAPVDYAIGVYREEGFDTTKVVIGLPLSGQAYTGVSSENKGAKQPFDGDRFSVDYINLSVRNDNDTSSFWFYLNPDPYTAYIDREPEFYIDENLGVTWLYSEENELFISMPTAHSMAMYVDYVKNNEAVGFQLWATYRDDDEFTIIQALNGTDPAELEPIPEPYSVQ